MLACGVLRFAQQEITNEVIVCECLLRGGDLTIRLGGGERQPDLAGLDIADQVRECGLVSSGGANQRNILPIHATHVEIDERPGDGTKQGLAPAAAEQLQHDQAPVPGDIVDHEVDALRAEDNHKVFTASYQAVGSKPQTRYRSCIASKTTSCVYLGPCFVVQYIRVLRNQRLTLCSLLAP